MLPASSSCVCSSLIEPRATLSDLRFSASVSRPWPSDMWLAVLTADRRNCYAIRMSPISGTLRFVRRLRVPTPSPSATRSDLDNVLSCSCKLAQEPHIAGIELADFADAVLHHGDALDAHSEGEAADLLRIVGGLLLCGEGEDSGIDHAAAEELDPAGVLAFAAPLATTENAADLDVG